MRLIPRLLLLYCALATSLAASAAPAESIDLAGVPRLNYVGLLRQATAPQPIWTIDQKLPVGQPTISPNGRWLLIVREGDWYRQGEHLMLVDLAERKVVQDQQLAVVGIISKPYFAPDENSFRAVVDIKGGCALARWSVPDLKLTTSDLGFGRAVTATLSHKQDKAVIMREDGIIGVFDTATGGKLLQVDFHKTYKRNVSPSIAITWDDKIVTSGIFERRLCSWTLTDGVRRDTRLVNDLTWGYPVEYTADNKKILIPAWHSFVISDGQDGKPLYTFRANGLRSLSYNPIRNLVAAPMGGGDTFGVVDANTGQMVMWVNPGYATANRSGDVSWACLSPDGRLVYSGGFTSIKAWDLAAELAKGPDLLYAGHKTPVIALSPDRARLQAFGETLDTWELRTRRLLGSDRLPSLRLTPDYESGSPEERRRITGTYTVNGNILAIVTSGTDAEVFDTTKGEMTLRLGITLQEALGDQRTGLPRGETLEVTQKAALRRLAQVFPRGGRILSASKDGTRLLVADPKGGSFVASIWSLKTGKLIDLVGEGHAPATVARFLDDRDEIVTGDDSGNIMIFDRKTGAIVTKVPGTVVRDSYGLSLSAKTSLETTDDGSQIYACDRSGTVSAWINRGDSLQLLFRRVLPMMPRHLAVSPDHKLLAVSGAERVAVLSADTGEVLKILQVKEDETTALFVSDNQIVTNGIRIWSLE